MTNQHPHSLSLQSTNSHIQLCLSELFGFRQWRNSFDAESIELLTSKTGSAKSFATFAKMIAAAVEKTSSTVSFRVMTQKELDRLRSDNAKPAKDRLRPHRYVILSYSAEFDSIHYPLVLLPADVDDPEELKKIIFRLRQRCGFESAESSIDDKNCYSNPDSRPMASVKQTYLDPQVFNQGQNYKSSSGQNRNVIHNQTKPDDLKIVHAKLESLSRENEKLKSELQQLKKREPFRANNPKQSTRPHPPHKPADQTRRKIVLNPSDVNKSLNRSLNKSLNGSLNQSRNSSVHNRSRSLSRRNISGCSISGISKLSRLSNRSDKSNRSIKKTQAKQKASANDCSYDSGRSADDSILRRKKKLNQIMKPKPAFPPLPSKPLPPTAVKLARKPKSSLPPKPANSIGFAYLK